MKRIAKTTFELFASLLLTLAAFLALLVARPEWFITPARARWAVARFGKAYRPAWKTLEPAIHSRSFLDKTITLTAADFCFDAGARGPTGCFPALDAAVELRLGLRPLVKISRLERLIARAGPLRLARSGQASKTPKRTPTRGFSLPSLVPRIARGMTVGRIDVDVRDLAIQRPAGSTRASAWARYPERGNRLKAAADVVTRTQGVARAWKARIELASDLFDQGTLTFLDGRGVLAGPREARAKFRARVSQAGRRLRVLADVSARRAGDSMRMTLSGIAAPRRCDLQGALAVAQATGPVRSAALTGCSIFLGFDERASTLRRASLGCGVRVEPAPFDIAGTSVPAAAGRLAASVDENGSAFSSLLKADLAPEAAWKAVSARLEGRLFADLRRLPDSLRGQASAALGVRRFEDLVAYLKGTAYSVPAPINVLKGPLTARLSVAGDMRSVRQGGSYLLTTDLAGAGQRLKTSVTGTVAESGSPAGKRVFDVAATADLQDVALDLPYLRIGPMPKVLVDSRIRANPPPAAVQAADPPPAPAQASTGTVVRYDARIFTSKPALLRSNLASSPIPVSLDMRARRDALSGTISIGRFDAELFRQTATIDHVTLSAVPGSSEAGLDGLLVYKRPEAVIYIHLLGSTAKPQVSLSSDPPMTRDEIVALLLYGHPPDALDQDQRANVGNASNGMASGAFGLASLFLFASTPIEYVGYDPTTRTYAVRLKIPAGVHMELGSSSLQESRYLTLRKRLAPHWQVETQAATTPEQGSAITTFLEWFERY